MQSPVEDPAESAPEPVARPASPPPATTAESKEDRERRLIELLGEVIRMSQAWVGALESGDPFTAEKYEVQCLKIMDKFETKRKRASARAASFEQTR
jgi:hypothetical protein